MPAMSIDAATMSTVGPVEKRRWRLRDRVRTEDRPPSATVPVAASRGGEASGGGSGPDEISPLLLRTDPDRRTALTPESRQLLRRLARRSARAGDLSPLGYNLTISHERKFMWFRVAKVGTRTILGHFEEYDVALDVHHAMRVRYPTAAFEDYFKFAFVRHPLDRFVSAWRNKVVDNNYFEFDPATHERMQQVEEFARWTAGHDLSDLATADHHLALQTRLIDLTQVDYVGRLETFDDDFAAICERVGVPATQARVRNRTSPRDGAAQPVSDELRSLVGEIYRRDFQVFGY